MTPLTAPQALDQFFLEARSRLLDVAAILDRIDRGGSIPADPRLTRIAKAIEALAAGPGRAEAIQKIFSLDYDSQWPRPTPR